MVICLNASEAQARKEADRAAKVAQTRQGAELLASRETGAILIHLKALIFPRLEMCMSVFISQEMIQTIIFKLPTKKEMLLIFQKKKDR